MGPSRQERWPARLTCLSWGLPVGLRAEHADDLEALRGRLPPGSRITRGRRVRRLYSISGRSRIDLRQGASLLLRARRLRPALDAFESDLQMWVAEHAPGWVFVHAGVVGWRGRAIVVPGRSFSGKSTLVAALVRQGATYYSDEYAPLDAQGRVHAYPRPIGLRPRAGSGRSERLSAEDLGGAAGRRPLRVALAVVTHYRPGAAWRPRTVPLGRGVLDLLRHTVPARERPAEALAVLARALGGARILKGARGEANEAARRILRLLD